MRRLLFDSNIIIYYLNNTPEVNSYFEQIKSSEIIPVISVISKIEVLSYPNIKQSEIEVIKKVLDDFEIVDLTENIIENTIQLKRNYNIKLPDAIIAATAMQENIGLLTRDEKDFQDIKSLTAINPFSQ